MCPIFDYKIRPVLFVRLITLKRINKFFNFNSENNIYNRFFSGIADANDFFVEGYSDMCCYINCYIDFKLKLEFYYRNCIVTIILEIIKSIIFFSNNLSDNLQKKLYNDIVKSYFDKIFNYLITK